MAVDDEIGPRESLRMILQPIYEVHTAENGLQGLKFIKEHPVDLVTIDLNMPGITGVEVLKEIKKIRSDIEAIIITGFGTLSDAIEAIRYGAVDFISKPFNVPEILTVVSKSFERRNFNLKIKNLIQKIKDHHLFGEDGQWQALSSLGESLNIDGKAIEIQKELRESLQNWGNFGFQKVSVNYLDFLKVLIYILESKEPYTSNHSERVSFYAELIAQDLHLPKEERANLQISSLLHDIGKIGISNHLLQNSTLSQTECLDIQQHPMKGVHLIEPLALSPTVTSAIRHHHEWWDGNGYPDGLVGENIPLLARIIALADSYDAMISDRPYRRRLSFKRVREEIERNSGIQFDPHIVPLFTKHIQMGKGLPMLHHITGSP